MQVGVERHEAVDVTYEAGGAPDVAGAALSWRIPTDGHRAGARLQATLGHPEIFRDGLLTLGDVLSSDLRRKSQDRADYLAYKLAQGKGVSLELWNAQKAYLEARYGEAVRETRPLDPLLTVADDSFFVEVFSADESAYARLTLEAGDGYEAGALTPGTTHLELTLERMKHLTQFRSYRKATLEFSPSQGGSSRSFNVPHAWIRSLLQVQAASTLPGATFQVSPIDLYNVLLLLRLKRAKKGPRALRFELTPGEVPKMVLEPWDRVLETTGGVYSGDRARVVRTFGRLRLGVLSRLLPHSSGVSVTLLGPGLPTFYTVTFPGGRLLLALSGFTDAGWSGVSSLDMLGGVGDEVRAQVKAHLGTGPVTLEALAQATGQGRGVLRQALLAEIGVGQALYEPDRGTFRHRPVLERPLDENAMRYRDAREADAHRLLEGDNLVRLTRIHDLGAEGTRIEGEVVDPQAHRTYQSSFTLDREGRTVDATCSSPQFRRSGLKEGPTVPMLALRLRYERERQALEEARNTPEGRRLIRAETRSLMKRVKGKAQQYRVTLDERQVVVRWGQELERMQRTFFLTAADAQAAYFERLEDLMALGYLDTSASGG